MLRHVTCVDCPSREREDRAPRARGRAAGTPSLEPGGVRGGCSLPFPVRVDCASAFLNNAPLFSRAIELPSSQSEEFRSTNRIFRHQRRRADGVMQPRPSSRAVHSPLSQESDSERVSVWPGCYDKRPCTGRLVSNRRLFLVVLEAGRPRPGCQRDRLPAGTPLRAADCSGLLPSLHGDAQREDPRPLATLGRTHSIQLHACDLG